MDTAQAKIRTATPDDLELITRLFEKLIRDQMALETFFKLAPAPDFKGLVQSYLGSGNNLFLLAEQNREVAGFIRLNVYAGANLERLTPTCKELSGSRFTPRRILRKILAVLLNRLEKPDAFPEMFIQVRTGYIADLYVLPENRRQGLGSLLVAKALEWFKDNQISLVQLRAVIGNRPGVNFWEKQGFSASQFTMRRQI